MNEYSSSNVSHGSSPDAEAISRRAYELWEQEGRPDGADLRHWLQAEKEVSTRQEQNSTSKSTEAGSRNAPTDTRPLQGMRSTGTVNRDVKRGSIAPFSTEKNATAANTLQAKRKPTSTPVL